MRDATAEREDEDAPGASRGSRRPIWRVEREATREPETPEALLELFAGFNAAHDPARFLAGCEALAGRVLGAEWARRVAGGELHPDDLPETSPEWWAATVLRGVGYARAVLDAPDQTPGFAFMAAVPLARDLLALQLARAGHQDGAALGRSVKEGGSRGGRARAAPPAMVAAWIKEADALTRAGVKSGRERARRIEGGRNSGGRGFEAIRKVLARVGK